MATARQRPTARWRLSSGHVSPLGDVLQRSRSILVTQVNARGVGGRHVGSCCKLCSLLDAVGLG